MNTTTNTERPKLKLNLDGSPATLVTKTEISSIINKPKFVKKAKNSTDVSKTVRNEIESQHNA